MKRAKREIKGQGGKKMRNFYRSGWNEVIEKNNMKRKEKLYMRQTSSPKSKAKKMKTEKWGYRKNMKRKQKLHMRQTSTFLKSKVKKKWRLRRNIFFPVIFSFSSLHFSLQGCATRRRWLGRLRRARNKEKEEKEEREKDGRARMSIGRNVYAWGE